MSPAAKTATSLAAEAAKPSRQPSYTLKAMETSKLRSADNNVWLPAQAEPAVLSLEAVSDPCMGTTLSRRGVRLTVARTKARDLHIKGSAVSEKHAELHWEGRRWPVTDVGSSNGTVLNGRKLSEGN